MARVIALAGPDGAAVLTEVEVDKYFRTHHVITGQCMQAIEYNGRVVLNGWKRFGRNINLHRPRGRCRAIARRPYCKIISMTIDGVRLLFLMERIFTLDTHRKPLYGRIVAGETYQYTHESALYNIDTETIRRFPFLLDIITPMLRAEAMSCMAADEESLTYD